DLASGAEQRLPLPSPGSALALSPVGRWLAAGTQGGPIELWPDGGAGQPVRLIGHTRTVLGLALIPDGRRLPPGGADGAGRRWDPVVGEEVVTLPALGSPLCAVAFSRDGGRLAAASANGIVRVWEGLVGPLPDGPPPEVPLPAAITNADADAVRRRR